ncbi:MAG: glycosyltransferase [Clostridia bacterium]|nr:glycosyltransferase [Clostridia bacterium]
MKVLLVNKFLYPKGGAETYVFKLGKVLEREGHEVQYFGLKDDRNIVGNRFNALAQPRDFQAGLRANFKKPLSIIYNSDARKQIRRVLEDFNPDVVHLNNIHYHLTPSIIRECGKYRKQVNKNLKIVYTAHDYQLICPSHGLFDNQLNICEKCIGGNYLHCLKTKCIKNSYLKSLIGALDAYFWKAKNVYSYVDTIICCSHFLKSKLDTDKRFRGKTIAIHNFIEKAPYREVKKQGYILEFGHLSKDKGTYTVLEVAKRYPEIKFIFAGFGEAVEDIVRIPNAEYVGFQSGEKLEMLIRNAALTVCPSECYENCPFSVIESQMYGTPVVGSNRGGTPELIERGVTGEVFNAGDADDLERQIMRIYKDGLERYTQNCLKSDFETQDTYIAKLLEVYRE